MTTATVVKRYFDTLAELLHGTAVTTHDGSSLSLDQAVSYTHLTLPTILLV